MLAFTFTVFCLYITLHESSATPSESLKLVHAIFRHGDRTPVRVTFPINPYTKEKYLPYGYGQLTNKGKQTAYNLGIWLRRRYSKFLNRSILNQEVSAVSTSVDRCKSTIALVLAGLYPPKETPSEWNKHLNWSPIDYEVLRMNDPIMMIPSPQCKTYLKLIASYTLSKPGQTFLEKYNPINEYFANYSILGFRSILEHVIVYDTLSTQKEIGLKLPEWADEILTILRPSPVDLFKISMATVELQKIVVGHLIRRIIVNTTLKLNNTKNFNYKRMFLYSGHDFNVSNLLQLINPKIDYERPAYGACVIFEIHTIKDVDGVMVFYQHNNNAHLRPINIHKCGKFCPLEKFIDIFKKYYPVHNYC